MSDFDYTPSKIRESVKCSLERLHTDYFDVVHLHDIEFVCTEVAPRRTGNHTSALAQDEAAYGLLEGEEGKIRGDRKSTRLNSSHVSQSRMPSSA